MAVKLKLPITLIAVAGNRQAETVASLYKSMAKVDFKAVVMVTNVDIQATGIEIINVGGLKTWAEYNHFIIKELYKYFQTEHCLLVQWDSWVLNPECWDEEFLNFDLIGARGLNDGRPNFNGGFTLRSYRFQYAIAKDNFIEITAPEDESLTRLYRSYIEKTYGFRYCTEEVADIFAYELHEPTSLTFGFHAFHHNEFKRHIIIRRNNSMGDIIMLEPLVDYYSKKGFQIVLDVPENDMRLFACYPHFVKHISQMNPKIVPYKDISLNMAYEISPKRRVLESYYEIAGIKDGEIRNSRLFINQEPHQRLFQKYILIHIDNTGMEHRNTHEVNWEFVVNYYTRLGYLVLQVGFNSDNIVAPHFNTPTRDMLLYICKGADLVIGIDSGICQVSVALGTPCVILVGSVDLKLRYVNFDKIGVVQGKCPDESKIHCYHSIVGVRGVGCVFDDKKPYCARHDTYEVIREANKLMKI